MNSGPTRPQLDSTREGLLLVLWTRRSLVPHLGPFFNPFTGRAPKKTLLDRNYSSWELSFLAQLGTISVDPQRSKVHLLYWGSPFDDFREASKICVFVSMFDC